MRAELSMQGDGGPPASVGSPGAVRELKMPADFRAVGAAREMIHSTGLELGLDEAAIWDVKVAATEALANAIEHGWARDGLVHMRLAPEHGELLLEVSGGGATKRPPADKGAQGGRGFAIMSALMDEVAMRRDGEETVVRLAKRLAPLSTSAED